MTETSTETTKVLREMEVELTPDERATLLEEQHDLACRLDDLEEQKKDTYARIRADKKEIKSQERDLRKVLRSNRQKVEMTVIEERDFGRQRVRYLHADTHAVLEERDMTEDELQTDMDEMFESPQSNGADPHPPAA